MILSRFLCLLALAILGSSPVARSDDFVSLSDERPFVEAAYQPALDLHDEVTLAAWVKPGTLPAGGGRILDRSRPGTQVGYVLDTFPRNSLRLICAQGLYSCDAKLPAGQWTHVAAVFSRTANVLRLYVNGRTVLDAGKPDMKPLTPCDSSLRIGSDSAGENCFAGDISLAAVYGRALGDAEVAALAARREAAPPLAGVVGAWDLSAAAGGSFSNRVAGGPAMRVPSRWLAKPPAVTYAGEAAAPAGSWNLWYRRPAQNWNEALPLGNGHIGAMIYGNPAREQIQLNEHTIWTGQPHDYAHPGAAKVLPELRRLLFAGQQRAAEDLAMKEFMSLPLGQKTYQPLGDLWIDLPQHAEVKNYRRILDLDTAAHTVEYQTGGATFRRETFDSFPDRVLVSRLTADQAGQITCTIRLTSPHKMSGTTVEGGNTLVLRGQVEKDGVAFESRLLVRTRGGTLVADEEALRVTGADEVELLLAAASNVESWKSLAADPAKRCQAMLGAAAARDYKALRRRHQADHQTIFRRVELDLGRTPAADLPTDERLKGFATGADPQLAALTFQYGRYLLLGSSRAGGQPANLQGIWNDSLRPPWDSKYTCNINTEMNYWPVEVAALPECHDPLFVALGELMESGRITAREHYGARGWVLHHNFDLWRGTAPINHSNHGIWVTGGAWLSLDLWEHYLFTQDRDFLRARAYPIMKEAALFFTDYLVELPGKGWLVSGPSNSPEQGGLVMGPTMDHEIIRSLFRACVEASRVLGADGEFAAKLETLIPRIAPNQIGKHGQLQEWVEDKDDPNNKHRHVSHLWGAYPGCEINWRDTPDLWKAARQSLIYRGDGATGWSMGWKVCLWARFLDGNHAYLILGNLLAPVGSRGGGGMYPNLFDAHPPFQIDGNFGACAGIAEMLMQSQLGEIHVLPALPDAWPDGRVEGLRARGNVTVGVTWKGGRLAEVRLLAPAGGSFPLRYGDRQIKVDLKSGQAKTVPAAAFGK